MDNHISTSTFTSIATSINPYVFVLDWDGSVAGDVSFQSQYYSIVAILKKHGVKPKVQHPIPHAFAPSSKLIRPGFTDWMQTLQKIYPEVYFFIYTASMKNWALQEIAWVEKLHDIKFARPIFTRDDCTTDSNGNMRKSLARIFPRIIKTISKSRTHPLTIEQRKTILDKNILIIDNNAVYTDRTDKLLLCPDYGYAVFENLLSLIPKESRKTPEIQQLIYSLINAGYLCTLPGENDDGMYALSNQYSWLAAKCKSLHELNKKYARDDFWKHLRKMIVGNKIDQYSASIIKQLQDASWKHAKKNKIH